MSNINKAVKDFSSSRSTYISFSERIESLINELLKLNEIKVHLVESRTKSVESFKKKISKPEKMYKNPLIELTDLSGIRVIVYYQDDIEKVAKIIRESFSLVEEETSHMSNNYSANEFGYLSLHYIVKLSKMRAELPEWSRYKDLVAEIQIRTVLQHSWAAISHALQYKNENEVPKILQRKLFRLAGLFELADEEFLSLRNKTELEKQSSIDAIAKGDKEIEINLFTLQELLSQWEKYIHLKTYFYESEHSFNFKEDIDDDLEYYNKIIFECTRLGIKTIDKLKDSLNIDFKNYFVQLDVSSEWRVSDSFVLYLMIIRVFVKDFDIRYLEMQGWDRNIAKRVIEGAKKDLKDN